MPFYIGESICYVHFVEMNYPSPNTTFRQKMPQIAFFTDIPGFARPLPCFFTIKTGW